MERQRRNTRSKQLMMNLLDSSQTALCHEEIDRLLAGQIDRVTIYRILQGFCDQGRAHKITGDNGKAYYALCHDCNAEEHHDDHLHFRCTQCRKITCLDVPVAVPALPTGYTASDISCIVSGCCPDCHNRI